MCGWSLGCSALGPKRGRGLGHLVVALGDGGPGGGSQGRVLWWWEGDAHLEDLGLAHRACSLPLPPSLSSRGPMLLPRGPGICRQKQAVHLLPTPALAPGLGQIQGQSCHCQARKAPAGHPVWQLWGLGDPQRASVLGGGRGPPPQGAWLGCWGYGTAGMRQLVESQKEVSPAGVSEHVAFMIFVLFFCFSNQCVF